MCPKGKSMVELTYSPHRILYPMLREGNTWKRISYASALDMVAKRILRVKEEHPDDFAHRVVLFEPLWESRESELAAKMAKPPRWQCTWRDSRTSAHPVMRASEAQPPP